MTHIMHKLGIHPMEKLPPKTEHIVALLITIYGLEKTMKDEYILEL